MILFILGMIAVISLFGWVLLRYGFFAGVIFIVLLLGGPSFVAVGSHIAKYGHI